MNTFGHPAVILLRLGGPARADHRGAGDRGPVAGAPTGAALAGGSAR